MAEKSYTSLEDQYQTVNLRKTKEELTTTNTVEEILKKLVPAKSFLYRNQEIKNERIFSSYLPMDTGTPKKPKKFFRMSSYDYPIFGEKNNKTENFNDRGYYSVKTNSKYYIQKTFRITESKNKYKSIATPEEVSDAVVEDHFYEDLCYNDVEKPVDDKKEQTQKPYKVKIQEMFQSFRLPFFKRSEEVVGDVDVKPEVEQEEERVVEKQEEKEVEKEKESNFYENGDLEVASNMYDSVRAVRPVEVDAERRVLPAGLFSKALDALNLLLLMQIPVEDYLEPIQLDRLQYCDVTLKEDSLLQYIMNLFENFGMRRETNEDHSEDSEVSRKQPSSPEAEAEWKPNKTNMADRPLPVPIENEPYYMNIDRCEAENLLKGEPDGTFILRPSSQPEHAYTLTVSCARAVHNVGVRRRPDARLALGYPRRGERSFPSVGALLRHHRRRRLLLVAGGGVVGATTLNEPPRYYQTPSSLPVPLRAQ